eukprot:3918611-Rhodomonas_salina.1
MDPLSSSTKGSFTGYLRDPHSTECSRMWGIPVESSGGVRKVIPKHLFSSGTVTDMISAPVFLCVKSSTLVPYSSTFSLRVSSYLSMMGAFMISAITSSGLVATILDDARPERGMTRVFFFREKMGIVAGRSGARPAAESAGLNRAGAGPAAWNADAPVAHSAATARAIKLDLQGHAE